MYVTGLIMPENDRRRRTINDPWIIHSRKEGSRLRKTEG